MKRSLLGCVALILASVCKAEVMELDLEAHYKMSEHDSIAQARNYCIADAKQQAANYGSSFVETSLSVNESESVNGNVVSHGTTQTHSLSIDLITAKLLEENIITENNTLTYYCTVHTKFDPDDVKNKIETLVNNKKLEKQLDEQSYQISQLKKELIQTKETLASSVPIFYTKERPDYDPFPQPYETSAEKQIRLDREKMAKMAENDPNIDNYPIAVNVKYPNCVLFHRYLIHNDHGWFWYTCAP